MAEKLDPKETNSILELTVSNMWSIAALVEVLERKGLLTKEEVRDVITELRRQTPKADQASPPLESIPEPYLMRDTEDRVLQVDSGSSQCERLHRAASPLALRKAASVD